MSEGLSPYDYVVLVLYFVVIVGVGLSTSLFSFIRAKYRRWRNPEAIEENVPPPDSGSYFLAGRNMSWWAVGASLFSSNIGGEHFIGLAATGAREGIVVGWFEWTGLMYILLLAYLFVPIYLQSRIVTTPEYLEKRFNKHIRTYLAVLSMIIYIFTKVSVTIFAAAVVFDTILQLNIWISATIILIATGVYTVAGGLSAVIYTEALQTVVLLVGAIVLSILAYIQVDGLHGIMHQEPEKFHLFKSASDKEFPWTGVVIGMPLSGIWYWCSDQVIVQRVLAAKNEGHAKTGCVFAALMKVSTMFILVVPGVIAGHLFPEEIKKNSNAAFPLLVTRLMPPVLKGVMISAMLAAAMSSLASVFNSASTIFTMDIYKRIRPAR
jgi:SSS family solute:Na+ symporter